MFDHIIIIAFDVIMLKNFCNLGYWDDLGWEW
jgi:hypothetical protein